MTRTIARLLCVTMALGGLAACSSGGGGGGGTNPGSGGGSPGGGGGVVPSIYGEMAAGAQGLRDEIWELNYTDPVNLPDSSTADYKGLMGLAVGRAYDDPESRILGEFEMNVSFDGSTPVSGTASKFVNGADGRYTGELDLSEWYFDTTVDPNVDYQFGLDVYGNLISPEGVPLEVIGEMEGNFFGPEASHVAGYTDGDVYVGNSSDPTWFEGSFAAERQP